MKINVGDRVLVLNMKSKFGYVMDENETLTMAWGEPVYRVKFPSGYASHLPSSALTKIACPMEQGHG